MDRPFDWAVDGGRFFPAVVGYGRGRRLFDPATERQLKAEDQLRHRRAVTAVEYTPAEGFPVATLTCGHRLRLPGVLHVTDVPPQVCPECAA